MFRLQRKTILIISPQEWGKMFISKHHYALELAKKGNTVFFLNPPAQDKGKAFVSIEPSKEHSGLFLIYHRLWFPFVLKFHFLPLFQMLMKFHIRSLLKKINRRVDIVWSFDLGNMYPFRIFDASILKIFHPVDEPLQQPAIDAAKDSDIIFSVTKEILEKYEEFKIPAYLISHGVSEKFLCKPENEYERPAFVKIGVSGNLLRGDLDRETFLTIIQQNPGLQFHCWGSYEQSQANIGGDNNDSTLQFIKELKSLNNVKLHGAVDSAKLAEEIQHMDAFLICYDIKKDQSRGTNYHKIMEYLSTGKVIISNNVSAYHQMPGLVQMTEERDNNNQLPALFKKMISSLEFHNSLPLRLQRYDYASRHTYSNQVDAIESKLLMLRKNNIN